MLIPNAWVETRRRGIDKVQWSIRTDAGGRFAWESAPQEPLLYSFQADGFNRAYALQLQADGSDHEIRLSREQATDTIQLTGTALDAETGLPLDAFKVLQSDLEPDWAFPYRFAAVGKDGKFSLSFSAKSSHPAYQLLIEKEGYVPAVSTNFSRKAGNQTLEFRLRKGSGPSGIVLLPGGEPAAHATVLLCTPQAGVTLDGPAHVERGLNTTTYRAQTDEAGRFSLAAAPSEQGLIAIHDQGYAEVSLGAVEAAGSVMLQPWGRVEGKLVLDSQPIANERVVAYNHVARYDDAGRRFTFMAFHLEAKTDPAGRFVFEKVPPGQCSIFRQTLLSGTSFESQETSVTVNAGAMKQVLLGGSGRPIIGKVILAGASRGIDWQGVPVHLRSKTATEPGPRPKRDDFATRQAYVEAMDYFFEANRARRRFGAFCDRGGSFRLQDIPAGTYQLEIRLRGFKPDSVGPNEFSGTQPEIGTLAREISVPDVPEGQSAEALDLGILELVPKQDSALLPR